MDLNNYMKPFELLQDEELINLTEEDVREYSISLSRKVIIRDIMEARSNIRNREAQMMMNLEKMSSKK